MLFLCVAATLLRIPLNMLNGCSGARPVPFPLPKSSRRRPMSSTLALSLLPSDVRHGVQEAMGPYSFLFRNTGRIGVALVSPVVLSLLAAGYVARPAW